MQLIAKQLELACWCLIQSNIYWSHVSIHHIVRTNWLARHEYILLSHLLEALKATGNAPKEWRHSKLHQLGSSNTFSIHPLILGVSLSYWNLNYHICTENKPRANCCCCAKTLEICWLSRAEQPRGVWNQIAEQSWVRELLSWAADLQPVPRIGTIFVL